MVLRTPLVRQLDLLFKLVSMDTIRCWLWAEYLLLSLPFGNIHSFVWWGCILSYSRVDLVYQYPSGCQVSACIFETKSLTHIFCCRVVWYLLLPSIYLFVEQDDISYHPRYWSSNNPIQWDLWIDWSLWRCFLFFGDGISCIRVSSH